MIKSLFPRTSHCFYLVFNKDPVIIDEIEFLILLIPVFLLIFIIMDILTLIFKPFKIIYRTIHIDKTYNK